jgi:hypothetical protein
MLNKRHIIFIILPAIINLQMFAQKPSNEFSIYTSIGMPIHLSKDATFKGFGADIGLGYTAFVSQQIAFHLGAGFGLSNVEVNVDRLKNFTPGLTDRNGYLFDKHTTLSNYNEIQKTTSFNIPLMLQFQPNQQGFYAMGGAKIHLLHQTSYETKVATLNNAAYYPRFNNWATTQTFAGLGTFNGNTTTGNFKLQLFTTLSLEVGMKRTIGKNAFLYIGAYIDYSLTDHAQAHRKPFSEYTTPEHLTDLTLLTFANKINPTFAGIKLRYAFFNPTSQKTPRKRISQGGCPAHKDNSINSNAIFNRPCEF